MRTIHLTARADKQWRLHKCNETDYDELVDESCEVRKPDGSLLMHMTRAYYPKPEVDPLLPILSDMDLHTNNRRTASGVPTTFLRKKDGTIGRTAASTASVESKPTGFFERTSRFPYCRACAFNMHDPEKFAKFFPLLHKAEAYYAANGGAQYAHQRAFADATHRDWLIDGTCYTTMNVNRNFRTSAHLDAGDLPGALVTMAVLSRGVFNGANLVMPDFRIAFRLRHGDIALFDPHEWHGNTPLFKVGANAERYSLVIYYREKMKECGSAAQELERVKNRQLGTPLHGAIDDK